METTKKRPNGVGMNRWQRNGGKYGFRLLAVIERAKREGTLGAMSPHFGLEVTEQEAAARIRLDAERVLIAKNEAHIAARLEHANETRANARERRLRALTHKASRHDLTQEELAELMAA